MPQPQQNARISVEIKANNPSIVRSDVEDVGVTWLIYTCILPHKSDIAGASNVPGTGADKATYWSAGAVDDASVDAYADDTDYHTGTVIGTLTLSPPFRNNMVNRLAGEAAEAALVNAYALTDAGTLPAAATEEDQSWVENPD